MLRIGVIGQSGEISSEVQKLAEEVGKEIARQGAILFTGGTNGVMECTSRGAKSENGLVVGILPGNTLDLANDFIDIPITTGLSFDYRSIILVHTSDVLIMIGGGNGTLGELSTAYLNRKPVIVLEPSGGWAGKIKATAYEGGFLDERQTIKIEYAQTPQQAVEMAIKKVYSSF